LFIWLAIFDLKRRTKSCVISKNQHFFLILDFKLRQYWFTLFFSVLVILTFGNAAFAATVPDAPAGVSATAVSPTQINLMWSAPANNGGASITSYKIEFKSGGGSYTTLVASQTTTDYSHTGLVTGTTYSYKIYAINSVGTSIASIEVTAAPTSSSTGAPPGTPTGLVATAVSPTQVSLSWIPPTNTGGYPLTGYKIEFRVGGGDYVQLVENTASTSTTYSHTGLTTNNVYSYRVYAITSFGTSTSSTEAIAQPKATSKVTAPDSPTGLEATAVSPTQINLSWVAPSKNGGFPITGYKIESKAGSGSYTTLVSNTVTTATTYQHTSLTTGTKYTYKVSAINSVGTGAASSETSATPTSTSAASAPGPPSALTATAVSGTEVRLSWSPPANTGGSAITGYKIEFMTSSGSYTTLVANTASTTTAYSHAGLTSGQLYLYRVSAINAIGTSNPSPEASVTPTASAQAATKTVPDAPTGLTAIAVSGTQVNLSWSPPTNTGGSDITGYKVESRAGAGSYTTLANTATTTYSHTGLTTGTLYSYRVYATTSVGTGSPSGEASVTPKETTTPILSALTVSPTQVDLSWTAPTQTYKQRITGYKIEEKIGTSTRIVNDNVGNVIGYSVTGLTTGKSYTFIVSALFSTGASPPSNPVTVTPTTTSAPPTGYKLVTSPPTSATSGYDPNTTLKSQQAAMQKKIEQAREELKKKSAKTESAKAKAAREEAKKINEQVQKNATAARQKMIAEKQAELKTKQNKTADQLTLDKKELAKKKHEEAKKLRELQKQAKIKK
jgi:titin